MSLSPFARFLRFFPVKPSFAFAYGSRVKPQVGNNSNAIASSGDMVDLILAVDDPISFHEKNLDVNRNHYSFLKYLGSRMVTRINEKSGAKIYYNTLVPVTDESTGTSFLIKYGVIRTQDLINDLLDWETLYVSGRLHKPVEILTPPTSESLRKAIKINHQSAVHASLLLLDEQFTEESLLLTITGLSYLGDFRMIFGEDKDKVANIVRGNFEAFRDLYYPFLFNPSTERLLHWNSNSKTFSQDLNPAVILHHLNLLPKCVQRELYLKWSKKGTSHDVEDVLQHLSRRGFSISEKVRSAVGNIVWRSSWSQSVKGIATAGVVKSLSYSSRKVVKMLGGMRRRKPSIDQPPKQLTSPKEEVHMVKEGDKSRNEDEKMT